MLRNPIKTITMLIFQDLTRCPAYFAPGNGLLPAGDNLIPMGRKPLPGGDRSLPSK
jgi:hypothetical protein